LYPVQNEVYRLGVPRHESAYARVGDLVMVKAKCPTSTLSDLVIQLGDLVMDRAKLQRLRMVFPGDLVSILIE
jgi:hypothetical protein